MLFFFNAFIHNFYGMLFFSLLLGSFMGAAYFRLPLKYQENHQKRSLLWGRSVCFTCQRSLKPLYLIPLFSWIFLKGKCGFCKAGISKIYLLIELSAVIFYLISFSLFDDALLIFYTTILGSFLFTLSLIDLKHYIIPNFFSVSLTLLAIGYIYSFHKNDIFFHLGGGFFASGLFLSLYLFYLKIRKVEALGLGDVKLIGVVGLWVNIFYISYTIFIAAFLTLIGYGIRYAYIRFHFNKDALLPFGPGIALAFFLTHLYKHLFY